MRRDQKNHGKRVGMALIGVVLLSGCASVSIKDERYGGEVAEPSRLPDQIYLVNFEAPLDAFQVDRAGGELEIFRKDYVEYLSAALAERLRKHLTPTVRVDSLEGVPPGNHWVILGRFARVNQGSRALRAGIGFGAGGTKLETEVEVYLRENLSDPFLSFKTTGGSNAEPGVISAIGPGGVTLMVVSAAASAGGGAAHGLSEDATRTARVIVATLSDYAYKKDWIPARQRKIPKRID